MSDLYLPSSDEPDGPTPSDDYDLPGEPPPVALADDVEIPGERRARPPAPPDEPPPVVVPDEPADGDPPNPDPRPPGLPSEPTDGDRVERIARSTREGGLGRSVPAEYVEGDDWRAALSDDPFERLYLDRDQAGRITDDMVRKNSLAIQKFWERQSELLEGQGAEVRDRILKRYGDRQRVLTFQAQARDDFDRLETAEKRTAAIESVVVSIRTRVLKRFEDFIVDRALSPVEAGLLLDQAEAEGWGRDAAALFLLDELDKRAFADAEGRTPSDVPGPPRDVLLSSVWSDDVGDGPEQAPTPERAIGRSLATTMMGGALTAAQVRSLLDDAVQAGVEREAAAEFVADRLGVFRGEWEPALGEASEEGALSVALGSVRWLSPEEHAREVRALRERERRALETQRDQDRRALEAATATALAGGALSPSRANTLLQETDLAPEAAAAVVLGALERRGFAPVRHRGGSSGTAVGRLTAGPWKIPPEGGGGVLKGVLGVAIALAVVVAGLFAAGILPPEPDPVTGTVTSLGLNVRTEPTSEGGDDTVLGSVGSDEVLSVVGYLDNEEGARWLRVQSRVGEGWVSAKHMRFSQWSEVPNLTPGAGGEVGTSGPSPPPIPDGGGGDDAGSGTSGPTGGGAGGATGRTSGDGSGGGGTSSGTRSTGGGTASGTGGDVGQGDDTPRLDLTRVYEQGLTSQPDQTSRMPTVQSDPGGYAGMVRLRAVVERDGSVSDLSCPPGVSSRVCGQARSAAGAARFRPGSISGTAVRSRSAVSVRFTAPQVTAPPPPPPPPDCSGFTRRIVQMTTDECPALRDPTRSQACYAEIERLRSEFAICQGG